MNNLTDERLSELRALASEATPGLWEVEDQSHADWPGAHWTVMGRIYFGNDKANAHYVAAVSPDVLTAMLDEIEMGRANYDGAMADLAALVEVAVDDTIERAVEYGADEMGTEGAADAWDDAAKAPEVVAAFRTALDLLAKHVNYQMCGEKIGEHVLTYDEAGAPLLDGEPMYRTRKATDA